MRRFLFVSLLFTIISLILAFIWFHSGLFVAFGESEIPFYNPGYVVHFYGVPWSPTSLGFFPGTTLSLMPFFLIGSWISSLHIPGYVNEAFFFFLFSLLGMVGGYALVVSLFEGDKNKKMLFGIFGGLFYTLNFISLVIAFSRLQYPFTIFYLGIPVGLLFFILGILKKQLRYVLYFNLAVLFYSGGFGGLPFMEIVWYFLGTFILFAFLTSGVKKNKWLYPIFFTCLCVGLWILCNLWWMTSSVLFAFFLPHPAYSIKGNIGTLDILSDWQGNLSYLFRLMNEHYLQSMVPTWGKVFFSPIFVVISYIIPFLAFFPLLIRKKPKILYFFLGLALIVLFFTKGSAGPFGEFFLFLFSHLFFLQVFRNPFEKIGILLPTAYLPLLSYSMWIIFQWVHTKHKKTAYTLFGTVTVLLFGVLLFPFWNGWVFTYNQPPANDPNIGQHVQVPSYYDDANAYLNKDTSDTRILALPMTGEGITTTWPHPYNGVEYTNGLFSKSAISYSTIMPYLDTIANQLNYTFVREPQYISKVMQLLDAKYLLLRSDLDYKARQNPNPKIFTEEAHTGVLDGLTYQKTFGQLEFYTTNHQPQKIYVAGNATAAPKTVRFGDIFSQVPFSSNDIILSTGETSSMDNFAKEYSSNQFFQPESVINYQLYPTVSLNAAESTIPTYYRLLPGSKWYFLELLKEKSARLLTLDSGDKMFYDMDILSRRFGELQTVVLKRDRKGIAVSLVNTENEISFINQNATTTYKSDIQNNIDNFRYRMLSNEMLLNNLLTSVPDKGIQENLKNVKEKFDAFEVATSVKSEYDTGFSKENRKRIVYQFSLPKREKYNFVIKKENFSQFYNATSEPWDIYVNNVLFHITPTDKNGWFDFGEMNLQKGLNEIHVYAPVAKNLIEGSSSDAVKLAANKKIQQEKVTYPIYPFDPFSPYIISYDYRLNMSGGPKIQIDNEFNAPHADDGKISPQWVKQLEGTLFGKDFEWKTTSDIIYPATTANEQRVSFISVPADDCQHANQYDVFLSEKCTKDNSFDKKFWLPTQLDVKNVKAERIFSNTALLIARSPEDQIAQARKAPEISFKKLSTSKYQVSIHHATQPFLLVFSETYYNDWKAQFNDTHEIIDSKYHVLANNFANAWYITRTGDYRLTLEFVDARFFEIGKIISIPIISVCILVVILIHIKKRGKK